jgi:hypothetical protein
VRASGGSSQGVELVRASEWVVASVGAEISFSNAGCTPRRGSRFASTIDLCRRLPRQRRVGPPRNPVCARGMGNLRRSRSFAELLLVGRRATSRM